MEFPGSIKEIFNLLFRIVIAAVLINILFDAVMAAVPNSVFQQASQFLSYISGLSLITFLIGLANNPYFAAVADAIVLIFTIVGEGILSNLFSSPQTYAQTAFIIAYVTYIYSNAIFFFVHWIPLVVQGSIIAPVVLVFDDVVTSIFSISTIIYILMALGYIPQDV